MHPGYTESARLLLRQSNAMVSLPEICIRLRDILADPEHSRKDVADVMRYDPSMTARLLRIVNSAYYGLPYRVASISQALGILGEQELKNLVLVTSIMKMSKSMDSRMNLQQFWKTSVLTAVLARNLCSPELYGTREEYFLAGLLLNIGKLLLYASDPGLPAEVFAHMQHNSTGETQAEQALTGTDHTYVGALLANSWNFPDQLVELIASHHSATDTACPQGTAIIRLAAYCSDYHESSNGRLPLSGSSELQACAINSRILELDETALSELLQASLADHQEVYEVFCGDTH